MSLDAMSFDPMNEALLGAFGADGTVQLPDGNLAPLRGVLSTPYVGASLTGQSIERLDTTFEVTAGDWAACGGQIGTLLSVQVRGHDVGYTVTDAPPPDDGDMVKLVLRAFP